MAPAAAAILLLDVLALVGAEVHTMVPGEPARRATVLVEDGRIAAVGEDLEVPAGARVIDAGGLFLVPGLIDGFGYHDREHDLLYTAHGVTLLRDHGNTFGRVLEERRIERRDAALGPALSVAGPVIDGFPPATADAMVAPDAAAAAELVPALVKEGVDFLSIQTRLPVPAWRKVLAIGDEHGLQVWGPRPDSASVHELLASGQEGVLFFDSLLPEGSGWDEVSESDLDATVEALAASGARLTPLLRAHARLLDEPGERPAEFRWLGPQYAGLWARDLALRRQGIGSELRGKAQALLERQRRLLARMHEAGVPLVPGSGAPHPWLMPGLGLHLELEEWEAAGLEPLEVLRLATAGAADRLGLSRRGAIAPGKVADILALRADPAGGVAALREIELVVLRGRPIPRGELDRHLEELAAAQAKAGEEAARPIEVAAPRLPPGEVLLEGLSETRTVAGRVAAERWAVVREKDQDALSFCGRRRAPGGAPEADVEVEVCQRLVAGRFQSFHVFVRTGGHELAVRGLSVGGQMRVERRFDGAHVDTLAAREALAAIDVSSSTTPMLLAHSRKREGPFPVLRFEEDLEPEVVRWELTLQETGDLLLTTPQGAKIVAVTEAGAFKAMLEQAGSGAIETRAAEALVHGQGLPLPEATLRAIREARQRKEAREAGADHQDEAGGEAGGEDG